MLNKPVMSAAHAMRPGLIMKPPVAVKTAFSAVTTVNMNKTTEFLDDADSATTKESDAKMSESLVDQK